MFTAGLDNTEVSTSVLSATVAMLKSVWEIRAEMLSSAAEITSDPVVALPIEKLPPQSFVIWPQVQAVRLADLAEKRRSIAA
jgi:hypothetical protein